ncbi:MAG TPA: hypothetical protein VGO02_03680 [Burkholderiales bacterium]|nr:hypothetical protein [Burkholderiales bacterium]
MVAGLALAGFLVVAVVLPQMAGAETKDAAQALLAGVDAAQKQVTERAEKAGNLSGSGKEVKIAVKNDPKHGELKWLVAENGAIRGWNEKNAIEITLTPSMAGSKMAWSCKGYPMSAMPTTCGGRS